MWVIDQVARILNGTLIVVVEARWDDGTTNFRITTGAPSDDYLNWVATQQCGDAGPTTYDWDEGIAP